MKRMREIKLRSKKPSSVYKELERLAKCDNVYLIHPIPQVYIEKYKLESDMKIRPLSFYFERTKMDLVQLERLASCIMYDPWTRIIRFE